MKTLRVGTRPSLLAIRQVKEIQDLLPPVRFELVTIETEGDKDKLTSISGIEGSDFFTRQIEEALLAGVIDAAIHSAKDLEDTMPKELTIIAVTKTISPYDCLISRDNRTLAQLGAGSVVGTSSRSRKESILKYRNDLIVKDLRGNIDERLKKLDNGEFDAIIVAHAALIRLGYGERIAEIIPKDVVKPHPLQGSLAIQIRRERKDLIKIFRRIDAS